MDTRPRNSAANFSSWRESLPENGATQPESEPGNGERLPLKAQLELEPLLEFSPTLAINTVFFLS